MLKKEKEKKKKEKRKKEKKKKMLECPVYIFFFLRHTYLPNKASARDNRSYFLSLINSNSQQAVFNVATFLVCAFNLRTWKMEVPS